MVKVKYVGKGLVSRGYKFSPSINDGLYEVSKEDYKYLSETFEKDFIIIEAKVEKPAPEEKPKKPRARKKPASKES
jgi:hypothetical protein